MKETVQTGLRIPTQIHSNLKNRADELGISVNQLILVLIGLGLKFLDNGVIPPDEEK